MTRDGPETQSLSERLIANSAMSNSDVEHAILAQHKKLVARLNASSKDAATKIERSIRDQMSGIDQEVRAKRNAVQMALSEIEINPNRTLRKTLILSAVIGGMIAMIPWAAMSYLGMSATSEAGNYFEQIRRIRDEEDRISALKGIEIKTFGSETVLMLPQGTAQIYQCGETQTPCIKIAE